MRGIDTGKAQRLGPFGPLGLSAALGAIFALAAYEKSNATEMWKIAQSTVVAQGQVVASPGDGVCKYSVDDTSRISRLVSVGQFVAQSEDGGVCRLRSFDADKQREVVTARFQCTVQGSVSWAGLAGGAIEKTVSIRQVSDNTIEIDTILGPSARIVEQWVRCSGSNTAYGRMAGDQGTAQQPKPFGNRSDTPSEQQLVERRKSKSARTAEIGEAVLTVNGLPEIYERSFGVPFNWLLNTINDKVVEFGGMNMSSFSDRMNSKVDNGSDPYQNPKSLIEGRDAINSTIGQEWTKGIFVYH